MIQRFKRPDRKDALSIISAAKRDMDYTLTLDANEQSGSTIIKNIYECFRMLGDALLVLEGIESTDHVMPINELLKLNVKTQRPIGAIGNLRILRHNINYYGYTPKISEISEVILIAKDCFNPLYENIKSKIKL